MPKHWIREVFQVPTYPTPMTERQVKAWVKGDLTIHVLGKSWVVEQGEQRKHVHAETGRKCASQAKFIGHIVHVNIMETSNVR